MTGEVGAEIRKPGIGVVWIEKYAIFRQNADGVTTSLDHMMLAEVLPSFPDDRYHVEGFRGDETEPFVVFRSGGRLSYVNEWLIDRKVCSHDSAAELDARYPNMTCRFRVQDAKGVNELSLAFGGSSAMTRYPNVPIVAFEQHGKKVVALDSTVDARISWTAFSTVGDPRKESPLFSENLIFLLIDNCRGETVFSSGSGNKGEPLKPASTAYTIPAHRLEPGLRYTAFVSFINCRSTDTAATANGTIAAVAVNSIAVELSFETTGVARNSRSCPPCDVRANYRWPGKLHAPQGLMDWPVDSSGLVLDLTMRP
jgi:hypothetical protein